MFRFFISFALFFPTVAAAQTTAPASINSSPATIRVTGVLIRDLNKAWEYHAMIKVRSEEMRSIVKEIDEEKINLVEAPLTNAEELVVRQRALHARAVALQRDVATLIQEFEAIRLIPQPGNLHFKKLLQFRFQLMEELDRTLYAANHMVIALPDP
ncbi:hypothetical protein HZA86_04315 [Candidatus Uhrbacteria bacterium]|nr:hypothetical protein [Candidatus Uhrbacteria bacterium]